jgi:hypothetical protein
MTFTKTEPTENFDIERWVSSGGVWEIGFYRVMFGVRVRMGRVGEGYCILDLCAGADVTLRHDILRCVMCVLIPAKEDLTEGDLARLFPCVSSEKKPINLDECWEQLQQRALQTVIEVGRGKLKEVV